MAVSRDDRDSSDELLAAMDFLDEFQFALSSPPSSSSALHVDGARVDDDVADALGLAPLDALGSDDVLAEISTLATDSTLESSPSARHQLLSVEPALESEQQREQQQQSQKHRKRSVSNANSKQTQKTKKRKPSWNPNKARNERKGEIVYLHKQVTELEAQLAEIKAKTPVNSTGKTASIIVRRPHRDDAASADGTLAATRQSQLCIVKARAWEEIAKSQLDMRTKAERENIRLKLVLESQLKVAKNLGTHVDRAASAHEIQRCLPAKQVRLMYSPSSQRDESDATAIIDSLVAGLEQSYAELDAVFEANGLAESETSHINTQMHSNSDSATHSLLLEVFATKVLPFDFNATVKAVWDHFEFEKEPISRRLDNSSDSISTLSDQQASSIIKNFHLKLQAKGTTANFGVKQVIRRYDEQERAVIVWRSFFDPIESSCDEPLVSVRFLEKGYVVIKKPATIFDSFTLLQPCFIITPIFSEQQNGESYRHHHQPPLPTGAMADFVFATTVANIRTSHQMIVDTLLQQAMMVN